MPITNRTMQLGRLAEYQNREETLRIEIHAAVTAIITDFEPLDMDLAYINNIKPDRLQVNLNTIKAKKKELDKVILEIKSIRAELGQ